MTQKVRCPSDSRPDPDYPFRTELNEAGEIVYHVPVEAPEDTTLDHPVVSDSDCTFLYFRGGEPMRVRFVRTTDRAAAYNQRAWLNAEHTRDLRRSARLEFFEGAKNEEDDETIPRDEHPLLRTKDEGFIRVEYDDLPGLIARKIEEEHPDNPLYRQVFLLSVEEYEPRVIAEHLRIDQSLVYFYRREAYRIAREYKQKYILE